MPHRQWRLEFNVDELSDYDRYLQRSDAASNNAPFLTGISILTGTSERTMRFIVPIVGANNINYGICGFEISENFFKKDFAQPS